MVNAKPQLISSLTILYEGDVDRSDARNATHGVNYKTKTMNEEWKAENGKFYDGFPISFIQIAQNRCHRWRLQTVNDGC